MLRLALLPLALLAACSSFRRLETRPADDLPRTANPPFRPPEPGDGDWDWVQLTSDEWLKGELKYVRNQELEFDSDELDVLSLEWRKIKELKSPRLLSLFRENRTELRGPVAIRDGTAVVKEGESFAVFPRDEIVSIVPGGSERSYWSGKLSFGLTQRAGNTDQTDTTFSARVRRRAPISRLGLDYLLNFSKTNGEESANNQRFTGRYDVFLSQRWYVTPIWLEVYRDPFQNIDYRVTPLAGAGYFIFNRGLDRGPVDWDVALLAGYRHTEYESGSEPDGTATLGFVTNVDWDVTEKLEFDLNYSVQLGVPDTQDTNQTLKATLSWDVYGDLDLDLTCIWNYVGRPRADENGVTPKKSDVQLIVGLGWEF